MKFAAQTVMKISKYQKKRWIGLNRKDLKFQNDVNLVEKRKRIIREEDEINYYKF